MLYPKDTHAFTLIANGSRIKCRGSQSAHRRARGGFKPSQGLCEDTRDGLVRGWMAQTADAWPLRNKLSATN